MQPYVLHRHKKVTDKRQHFKDLVSMRFEISLYLLQAYYIRVQISKVLNSKILQVLCYLESLRGELLPLFTSGTHGLCQKIQNIKFNLSYQCRESEESCLKQATLNILPFLYSLKIIITYLQSFQNSQKLQDMLKYM